MGEGGLESRNALQLLHSCYNLQSGGGGGLEYEEFQNLYEEATGEKWTKITCPVMTRWYTVGLAAKDVIARW